MAEPMTLTLDGFLEEQSLHLDDASAHTFARTFPKTAELPETTVGLAVLIFDYYNRHYVTTHVPEYFDGNCLDGEHVCFLRLTVKEQKKELSPHWPNWQERFLLDCGYASNPEAEIGQNATASFKLFEEIPWDEREFLLGKHGLHKIATMVAHGYAWKIDESIRAIDKFRGDANYADVFRVLELGVPHEDLHLAAQLPTEMVKELYGPVKR